MGRSKNINWNDIQIHYDNGGTYRTIQDTFKLSVATIAKAVKRGELNTRSMKDAGIMYRKNNQNTYKHSDESKKKISNARKKFLKENPDKVPYLLNHYSKGDSYPEIYFLKCLENTSYIKKFRILNYELDFACIEDKIDLEIDGDQHFVDDRILKHDVIRNKILSELGWTIYRVRWGEFQKCDPETKRAIINSIIDKTFLKFDCVFLVDSNYDENSIYHSKIKKSNNCIDCGKVINFNSTRCMSCNQKGRYKIVWPDKSILEKLLWEIPTSKIAEQLGVSDKGVERYIKSIGLIKPPRGYWQKLKYKKLEQQDSNL